MLGAALRVGMLAQDVRFHPDEALYSSFARRMSLHGDAFLSDVPLDKPPLALVGTALSFSIFGPTEFAARLPTVLISLLTLAVLSALTRSLYGARSSLSALLPELLPAILLALSPLDLAFAATAFVDPLLTFWLLVTLLAVSRDRWRGAGAAFALAVATKQNAVPVAPLIIAIGVVCNAHAGWRWRDFGSRLRRFLVPVVVGALLLAGWSAARAAPIDFWTLGTINSYPDRLIRANEVIPRLVRWLDLLGNVTGFAPLLLLPLLILITSAHRRQALIDVVLATGVLAFLLSYWLIAFNTYDRYLHPLGPLILLLVARGITRLPRRIALVAAVTVIACMLPFTITALRGELTIGGDHGQNAGIDRVASMLNALPDGTVFYDYWLGWELGYYLGDHPRVRVVFEPSPQALARAVCSAGSGYFGGPAAEIGPWLEPLEDQGGTISLLLDGRLRLYRLDCRQLIM